MALWDGRFDGGPSQLMQEYGESLTVDLQMWAEDIEGSKAHAQMLFEVGLLTEHEKTHVRGTGVCMFLCLWPSPYSIRRQSG